MQLLGSFHPVRFSKVGLKKLRKIFLKRRTHPLSDYEIKNDERFSPFMTREVKDFSSALKNSRRLSFEDYENFLSSLVGEVGELVVGQDRYISDHKLRFYELLNAMLFLIGDHKSPKIAEFGVSIFSGLYKKLLPSAIIYTIDRPVPEDYVGFTEEKCKKIAGSFAHVSIDLTKEFPHANPVLVASGGFDLILFTEILEHLDVNPLDLFESLKKLLAERGWIYVSTPNFFSRKNLIKISNRENPCSVYPRAGENWDFHHHHREYEMGELLKFLTQAGLKVRGFYFSSCWDEDPSHIPDEELGNLVVVAQR